MVCLPLSEATFANAQKFLPINPDASHARSGARLAPSGAGVTAATAGLHAGNFLALAKVFTAGIQRDIACRRG